MNLAPKRERVRELVDGVRKSYFARSHRGKDETAALTHLGFEDLPAKKRTASLADHSALHIDDALSREKEKPQETHSISLKHSNEPHSRTRNLQLRAVSRDRRERSHEEFPTLGKPRKPKFLLTAEMVVQLPEFYNYVDKVLEYLDEIYYIEKKKAVLEKEEKNAIRLLPTELERIHMKATECAYAYSGILFHTVWHPTLKWEIVIHILIKVVRLAYKQEPDRSIVDKLMDGTRCLSRDGAAAQDGQLQPQRAQEGPARRGEQDALHPPRQHPQVVEHRRHEQHAAHEPQNPAVACHSPGRSRRASKRTWPKASTGRTT